MGVADRTTKKRDERAVREKAIQMKGHDNDLMLMLEGHRKHITVKHLNTCELFPWPREQTCNSFSHVS